MGEAVPLRREFGSPREDAHDARLADRRAHRVEPQGQRLEQLRRREHAPDIVARLKNRHRLIDHMIFVGAEMLHPALLDQFDHPARIQVDAEADAAAILREMLDRQAQPARTGRTQHEPVRAFRKKFVGQRLAEELVIDPEILERHTRLRRARCASGLKHIGRLAFAAPGDPAPHRTATQPLILEGAEALEIGEAFDLTTRIPAGLLCEVEPERAAGGRIKMPIHDLAHPRIEPLARIQRGRRRCALRRRRSGVHGP